LFFLVESFIRESEDPGPMASALDSSQSGPMAAFFQRRNLSFLQSLRHILEWVTDDLDVQQMFEDPWPAVFIPDRI
jgi:hypothetical protein